MTRKGPRRSRGTKVRQRQWRVTKPTVIKTVGIRKLTRVPNTLIAPYCFYGSTCRLNCQPRSWISELSTLRKSNWLLRSNSFSSVLKLCFFSDFDNLWILQHSPKQPEGSLMDRWLGRSIIPASSRACAAAGNRKPVLRRFRSQSCLYKLTLVDLWHRGGPRKILESSSRVIEDADVYFDASASRLIECVNGPEGKVLARWMPNAAGIVKKML